MAKPRDEPSIEQLRNAYIELSAPWQDSLRGSRDSNVARCLSEDEMDSFLRVRTDLHQVYIREIQRTRRIAMGLAAALLALACVIPVFAPAGRESLSYWIGLALFVFSAGSMGYTSIRLASEKRQLALSKDSLDA